MNDAAAEYGTVTTLSNAQWALVADVNRTVNAQVEYTAPSPWQLVAAGQDARGDCKTYATTKYQRLVEQSIPAAALHIVECSVPPATGRNHCVLGLLDDELGLYFLSNGFAEPLTAEDVEHMGWGHFGWFEHGTQEFREFTL